MHHKNRKPKSFKGHCWMCASRDHELGVRNKRVPTAQELRAPSIDEGLAEVAEQAEAERYPDSGCWDCDEPDPPCAACGGVPCDGLGAFMGPPP